MSTEWVSIPRREMEGLEKCREFRTARELLGSEMVIQTRNGPKRLRITQVEPFAGLDFASHRQAFSQKPRARGEFFVIWHRGNTPFLNYVVDPVSGTIVCVKRALLDGQEVSATRIIQELGLTRSNFKEGPDGTRAFRGRVNKVLDGTQTQEGSDTQGPITIEMSQQMRGGAVLEIRRSTRERAKNSLGLFGNIDAIRDR